MESARVLLWLLLGALTGMGEEEGRMGEWNISRAKPGTSQAVCAERGERKVSRKRSLTDQSFLLIECLILLMMEFIKVLKKRKEFIQFSS